MLEQVKPDEQVKPRSRTWQMLIDTDVHEVMHDINECLVPYLPNHWQRVAKEWPWSNGPTISDALPYPVPFANSAGSRGEWLLENGSAGTSLEALQEHVFEQEGVTVAVLNGFYHASAMRGSYEFATALASAYNDYQIEHWLEKDDRLRGSAHVVAHTPDQAVREINRLADNQQIVQVFLPLVVDRQYGDPFYWPIFEAAERHGLAIAMHHGTHTMTAMGYPRYWIEWHMNAMVHATHLQLTSLICNGVFERFPDLKVVMLEAGAAWVPWFMWRLDEQYKMFRPEVPWVKRLPSEHMRDNVRIAIQPMGDVTPTRFERLVELCDTDKIYVFATDYPHYDADSADVAFPESLPRSLREKVWFENALDAYPRIARPA